MFQQERYTQALSLPRLLFSPLIFSAPLLSDILCTFNFLCHKLVLGINRRNDPNTRVRVRYTKHHSFLLLFMTYLRHDDSLLVSYMGFRLIHIRLCILSIVLPLCRGAFSFPLLGFCTSLSHCCLLKHAVAHEITHTYLILSLLSFGSLYSFLHVQLNIMYLRERERGQMVFMCVLISAMSSQL